MGTARVPPRPSVEGLNEAARNPRQNNSEGAPIDPFPALRLSFSSLDQEFIRDTDALTRMGVSLDKLGTRLAMVIRGASLSS